MSHKEYTVLCEALSCLHVALCAMDNQHKVDFVDPEKVAKEETLNAFKLIDKITIEHEQGEI